MPKEVSLKRTKKVVGKSKKGTKARKLPVKEDYAVSHSEGSSFDVDSMSEFDFDNSDAEVEYWGRKLGITNASDEKGKKRLKDEFERDGLGDDFIDLFDFMEEMPKESKRNKEETAAVQPTIKEVVPMDDSDFSGAYRPPHLRKEFTVTDDGVLKKRSTNSVSLTGLLNRVSEGNLDSISVEIISLLSKQKVSPLHIAKSLISTACDNPHISITLQATFAAIVCAIAIETAPSNLYSGVMLANLVECLKTSPSSRTRMNSIRFFSILYSLGLFGTDVIISLLRYLANIDELDQESRLDTILTCLRFSGRVFKDTNRSQFNAVLDELIKHPLISPTSSSKKIEFLQKELGIISRSNFRAVDHLQTVCHWLATRSSQSRKSKLDHDGGEGSTLSGWKVPKIVENVQLVLVGAGRIFQDSVIPCEWRQGEEPETVVASTDNTPSRPSLEELAMVNRMTTETKKNAFMAIMGSVDADHAMIRLDQFELLKGSKNISSIVAVIIHCALMESTFNSFYSDIVDRLCSDGSGKRKVNLEGSARRKFSYQFKSEFRRLIRSGELDQERIAVISQMISRFVASGDVSIEDIFS